MQQRVVARGVGDDVKGRRTEPESGFEEVFYEVQRDKLVTWPRQEHLSDADLVERAGSLLWKRAQLLPEDDMRTGAARILHTVWIMLRAKGPRSRVVAAKAMRLLERICIDFTDKRHMDTTRTRTRSGSNEPMLMAERLFRSDRWSNSELPPRANVDRSRALKILLELIHFLRDLREKETSRPRVDVVARFTLSAILKLFPRLAGKSGKRRRDIEKTIAEAWQRRANSAGPSHEVADIKADRMLLDAFVVLGVGRAEMENWLKGASM